MNPERQLPLYGWLLVALFAWTTGAAAQQTPSDPRVSPLAGNDGVGGIEWQLPREPKKPGFKQGGTVLLPPPPPQSPNSRPSPLTVGSDDEPDASERSLARSLPGGREGADGELRLTPLADLERAQITALALSGAQAGAPAWLIVGSRPASMPLAAGLLGVVPERVVPLGRIAADGELLVRLPAATQLDGLVFQVIVRERSWASSRPLTVATAPN